KGASAPIKAASAALLAAGMLAGAGSSAAYAVQRGPAYRGRLEFKIAGHKPGPRHATVTASGAFNASGYFFKKYAVLIFPHGRTTVHRTVEGTSNPPPDLNTCTFTIRQHGTFTVTRATGRYRGLQDSGTFRTTVHGRLRKIGPGRCGKL